MGKTEFGELHALNPRDVWKNEEKDFTPWIVENIQKLSELIGVPFTAEQTEKKVGSYELDIYGRVERTDAPVIIENQLAETDHKHLGQLLTYAAGLDAGVIIWIATEVTDEHRAAVEWLNRNTNDNVSFFLVRPEVLKVDESKPAPRFILEASPSEFKRILREAVGTDEAPRHEFRRKFWADLLAFLVSCGHGWAEGRRTTKEAWLSTAIGKSGIGVNISTAMGSRVRVEIYCSHDNDKRLHKQLLSHKADIENAFPGEQVSWEPLKIVRQAGWLFIGAIAKMKFQKTRRNEPSFSHGSKRKLCGSEKSPRDTCDECANIDFQAMRSARRPQLGVVLHRRRT